MVSELEHGCENVAWLVNVKRGVVDELESVFDVVEPGKQSERGEPNALVWQRSAVQIETGSEKG